MATRGQAEREAAERPGDDETIASAVRALQAGEGSDTFEPIFDRYYRPLFTFFSNRPALREEADDLAQETLLRAYEKIDKYGFESDFGAWLRRIGENVWKNAVRRRRTVRRGGRVELVTALDDDGETAASPQPVFAEQPPTPEQSALAAERVKVLSEAMDGLPPGMRLCTELRLGQDLKYQEIADATGIGLNSVRSQLFEARKRLRPVLGRYFSDADF